MGSSKEAGAIMKAGTGVIILLLLGLSVWVLSKTAKAAPAVEISLADFKEYLQTVLGRTWIAQSEVDSFNRGDDPILLADNTVVYRWQISEWLLTRR